MEGREYKKCAWSIIACFSVLLCLPSQASRCSDAILALADKSAGVALHPAMAAAFPFMYPADFLRYKYKELGSRINSTPPPSPPRLRWIHFGLWAAQVGANILFPTKLSFDEFQKKTKAFDDYKRGHENVALFCNIYPPDETLHKASEDFYKRYYTGVNNAHYFVADSFEACLKRAFALSDEFGGLDKFEVHGHGTYSNFEGWDADYLRSILKIRRYLTKNADGEEISTPFPSKILMAKGGKVRLAACKTGAGDYVQEFGKLFMQGGDIFASSVNLEINALDYENPSLAPVAKFGNFTNSYLIPTLGLGFSLNDDRKSAQGITAAYANRRSPIVHLQVGE